MSKMCKQKINFSITFNLLKHERVSRTQERLAYQQLFQKYNNYYTLEQRFSTFLALRPINLEKKF